MRAVVPLQSTLITATADLCQRLTELRLLLLVEPLPVEMREQIAAGLRTCAGEVSDIEAAIAESEPVWVE